MQKFNQLQARTGSGIEFRSRNGATNDLEGLPLQDTDDRNIFKGVCLNVRFHKDNVIFNLAWKFEEFQGIAEQWLQKMNETLALDSQLGKCALKMPSISPGRGNFTEVACRVVSESGLVRASHVINSLKRILSSPQHATQYLAPLRVGPEALVDMDQIESGYMPDIPFHVRGIENPNEDKLVLCPLRSVEQLHHRFLVQQESKKALTTRLGTLRLRMQAVQTKQAQFGDRLLAAEKRQGDLAKRLLRVMSRLGGQEPQQDLEARVEEIRRELHDESSLQGSVRRLNAKMALRNGMDHVEPAVELSEGNLAAIRKHLSQQTRGLEIIVETLKRDLQYLDVMEKRA